MKIYTKKGDKGETQLLGGTVISKDNIRLECYGSIDELNAFIGHLSDQNINKTHQQILIKIQNDLFNLASLIAHDGSKKKIKMPTIDESSVKMLEVAIDNIDSKLPALREFILPSGDKIYSFCHIARTVCRRAERNLVSLSKGDNLSPYYLQYLNRLSDFLFVLSRIILAEKGALERVWEKNH
mgnify:CR=1 FL=1|tara:strand:- start:50 stop:598 length:549 start_codon:yes stop_codon:yes gene_type:complete